MAVKKQDPYLKRSSVNYRDPAAVIKEPVVEEAKPAKAKKAVKEPVVEE